MKRLNRFACIVVMLLLVAKASAGERRALLVGINEYKTLRDLRGCLRDLNHIQTAITELGFKSENTTTLSQEGATKEAVQKAFRDLTGKLAKDDLVLFYFAGHGTRYPDGDDKDEPDGADEALCMHESNMEDAATALTDDELRELIKNMAGVCSNIVIIIDACSSGSGTLAVGDGDADREVFNSDRLSVTDTHSDAELDMDLAAYPQDHVLLAACLPTQKSKETSRISTAPRCGVFTWFLTQELRRPRGASGDLWKKVTEEVKSFTNNKQTPTLYGKAVILDRFLMINP